MPRLIILVGVSGSGKSLWVKEYSKEFNISVVCPDSIRREICGDVSDQSKNALVWRIAKGRVVDLLGAGKDVILDATNLKSKERRSLVENLPGCIKYAKVFNVEPEVAYDRVLDDVEKGVDRSRVSREVILKQYENFIEDIDKLESDGFIIF